MQHSHHRESAWLMQALRDKLNGLLIGKAIQYPNKFPQACLNAEEQRQLSINPAPSESTVCAVYKYFIEKQRREESERYTRTFAGMTQRSHSIDTCLGTETVARADHWARCHTQDRQESEHLHPKWH
jgi:hypothetical protein